MSIDLLLSIVVEHLPGLIFKKFLYWFVGLRCVCKGVFFELSQVFLVSFYNVWGLKLRLDFCGSFVDEHGTFRN